MARLAHDVRVLLRCRFNSARSAAYSRTGFERAETVLSAGGISIGLAWKLYSKFGLTLKQIFKNKCCTIGLRMATYNHETQRTNHGNANEEHPRKMVVRPRARHLRADNPKQGGIRQRTVYQPPVRAGVSRADNYVPVPFGVESHPATINSYEFEEIQTNSGKDRHTTGNHLCQRKIFHQDRKQNPISRLGNRKQVAGRRNYK
jgi:hypothetical protein